MPPTAPGAADPAGGSGRPERRPRYVYDFAEGDRWMADLLGGKGANLAEMTRLGLPVPPGFTITTEACRSYLRTGREPETLREEIADHLAALERRMGRRLGRGEDPLLVSVRSGARVSMPGMMETVLDVGLSDTSVRALAGQAGDDRFAWDSYRRLIQMFGRTVLGIDGSHFDAALAAARREEGVDTDADLPADRLRALVEEFKRVTRDRGGREFPQDPREQLALAVDAVFDSWNTDRARRYRRQEHIPDDLGTAVSVCAMVFGNLGPDSGTGVAFTRDPATGRPGVYGDYLRNAQGEDVVAGYRNTVPLAELERIDPDSHRRLTGIMATLEQHYLDLCDIEFTIERGTLWMLQTRVGKRTAAAAFRIAAEFAERGVIDDDEALRRVDGAQLAQLMFPHFDPAHRGEPAARGIPASPGAAVGAAVFDSARAAARAARGERVVLVRQETNPDDLDGMLAAEGVLTSRGGKTSHAAVVARGMGRTCVCGADTVAVDEAARRAVLPGGAVVEEGDVISVDGTDGSVHLGEVPVVPSTVVEYFENGGVVRDGDTGGTGPAGDGALVRAVDRLLRHADRRRVLGVRANADTGGDARRAARFGAEGVGLCRTEHMFLGERRRLVERLVLAGTDREREEVLAELLPLQRADVTDLLTAVDGRPVTVRLLDPPLHEFLPDLTELSVRVALGGDGEGDDARLLRAVRRLHEQNPMLGLRGVRLGLVVPGLFAMQVRAVAEAAADLRAAGGDPRPEIMVPLVATVRELEIVREEAERVVADVAAHRGPVPTVPVGTMIELPRAALTAGEIAGAADFFSFGTNDLTQTVWGFSRDDVEGSFFGGYLERGVLPASPFETIDPAGVGTLVRTAARTGRATSPDLGLGVCGEHGGDPASVRFFHEAGLDYVSCSPFRVPVARLEAGRAAVGGR
ncbi:pyruvate, phosphate dikinase [Streptomyces bohaiensis]